jgi:phenylpropionate dioxygenase-like ring-hydroxylating dioxygenase large terminal subunit
MGILTTLSKIRANYPGGWKRYARGYQGDKTPQFVQPASSDDRRSLIPALGLKEYWQPALPAKDVGWKKPVGMKILGEDLVFFKDTSGEVQALWDYCPHRGVYLSLGDCFWKGYISCAYHGATYDGNGECVEFITEGPDSKMVGRLHAKKYPTRTLKGLVFVWMGEGEPVPIEEDVPPEFFDQGADVRHAWNYWRCNWMIALENTFDAHAAWWVHRDSVVLLRNRLGGRPRTPIGYRGRIVNNKAVNMVPGGAEKYYFKDGKIPYQMYYPRINGYWPIHRYRLLWTWFTERLDARMFRRPRFENPREWEGTRLPGMQRISHWNCFFTRWVVPVDENLTRVLYLCSHRPQSKMERLYRSVQWPFHNWIRHFNFSDQDYDAMRSARYQYPEYLSSTDSFLIAVRKLFAEHARGVERTIEVNEETTAEKLVYEADQALGIPTGAATIVQTESPSEEPEYLEVLRMTRLGGNVNR